MSIEQFPTATVSCDNCGMSLEICLEEMCNNTWSITEALEGCEWVVDSYDEDLQFCSERCQEIYAYGYCKEDAEVEKLREEAEELGYELKKK